MKKTRYTEEQIAFALRQADQGRRGRSHPEDGHLHADVLSLEETVLAGRWAWTRSGD